MSAAGEVNAGIENDGAAPMRRLPTQPPTPLDDVAALAAQLLQAPLAGLRLSGPEPPRFEALHGAAAEAERASLAAFADAVARAGVPVEDAGDGGPLRFRCGAPVTDPAGGAVGAVCVGDRAARGANDAQRDGLARLARQASALLVGAVSGPVRDGARLPLRQVADHLPYVIWTASPEGAVDYVSAEFHRATGLPELDLERRSWLDAIHPEDRVRMAALWRARSPAGLPYEVECRLAGASGEHRWHLVAARPCRDAEGRLVKWYGAIVDIHARHAAEEEARAAEERLRTIIATAPECVKVVSADGLLEHMNPAGLSLIEADAPEEAIGVPVASLVHPADRETFLDLHRAAMSGVAGDGAFRIVGLKGRIRWMESRVAPLRGPDGEVASALCITRDVTERRREDRLRRIEADILAAILDGKPLERILRDLEREIDALIPGARVAIVTATEDSGDGGRFGPAPPGAWSTPVTDGAGALLARFDLHPPDAADAGRDVPRLVERLKSHVGLAIERSSQTRRVAASEEHYRTMFDLVPVLIWEEDWREVRAMLVPLRESATTDYAAWLEAHPDFVEALIRKVRVLSVNRAAARMFAAESPEALMAAHERIIDSGGAKRTFRKAVAAYLNGEREFETENATVDLKGRRLHIFVRMSIPDFDSDDARFILSEMDITELKIATERLSMVVNATSDVIWDQDLTSGEIWCSEGLRTQFGLAPEAIASGEIVWSDLVHPDERDAIAAVQRSNLEGGADTWSIAYRLRRADGGWAHVADRGRILRDESGRALRMIGSIVDVTHQVEVEEQLRQSQRLEAVGRLTGGVAHDFNNLLTVILGAMETLGHRLQDDPEGRRLAEIGATAAERGAELTRRLLAFARKQPLAPRPTDMGELMLSMRELLRRTLTEQIEVSVTAEPDLAAELDPGQLEVALLNLAINSRDAMPEGGRLTLEAKATVLRADELAAEGAEAAPGAYVTISVRDDGAGMPPEVARRAFEPFFTTKEIGKGSGLGLSLVYGFVRQSRGHVSIRSEPGAGTTVRMHFPRAARAAAPVPEAPASVAPKGAAEHVLVVEDDDMVREHLVSQLGALGYRVTAAAEGAGALRALEGGADVDLLLTDVVMPGGMNGRQLADVVKVLRPGLRVLFTSGYSQDALARDGRLDPSVHLLSKPYRRQDLAAKLRQVLDG